LASRAVAEEAQKRVAEVQSEVETHRNALREVRQLAEGAQKKAASTEAQLGRLGRLEAQLLPLRTAPVMPALAPPTEIQAVVPIASTPGSAAPPQQSTQGSSSKQVSSLSSPSTAVPPQKQKSASARTAPKSTAASNGAPAPSGWSSAIVPDFPKLLEDFKEKQFTLLWRGSRDGFGADDFHRCCDGHRNTLTVVLDTKGNIFGGFTPVEWESDNDGKDKADPSLKSFLFTLKNPHNVPALIFALKAEKQDKAICCYSSCGPNFGDIAVFDNSNANTDSGTWRFGYHYTNDTGRVGQTFFTNSHEFKVKEIEVLEITE
jgi:hypothetical protein